jgi:hypothetical protein
MLVMKAWLETRWRLLGGLAFSIFWLAANYRQVTPATAPKMLIMLGVFLTLGTMILAGSGVKSQSSIGFPEGLIGSTQFTISLPVSRLKLLAVRTVVGMLETLGLVIVMSCLAWSVFPSIRTTATPSDFVKLALTAILFLTVAYGAHTLFTTFMDEPFSSVCAGWMLTLLLWLLHKIGPAVDIVRAFGQASPLITHRLPWTQMATIAGLALVLFLTAIRVVQTREY